MAANDRWPPGFPQRSVGISSEGIVVCRCQQPHLELPWQTKGAGGPATEFLWAWCPRCLRGWVHERTVEQYTFWTGVQHVEDLAGRLG